MSIEAVLFPFPCRRRCRPEFNWRLFQQKLDVLPRDNFGRLVPIRTSSTRPLICTKTLRGTPAERNPKDLNCVPASSTLQHQAFQNIHRGLTSTCREYFLRNLTEHFDLPIDLTFVSFLDHNGRRCELRFLTSAKPECGLPTKPRWFRQHYVSDRT